MSKELPLSTKQIENRIFTIRGIQVMLDSDLAEIYEVTTGRLNEQVKRNPERFPDDFMFQLTQAEWYNLKSHFATSSLKNRLACQLDGLVFYLYALKKNDTLKMGDIYKVEIDAILRIHTRWHSL